MLGTEGAILESQGAILGTQGTLMWTQGAILRTQGHGGILETQETTLVRREPY